jgi:hypothetical protein
MFAGLWRFWTDTWRAPGRARALYAVMMAAFAALAGLAIALGDASVATLAAIAAGVSGALALLAKRLARWTNTLREDEAADVASRPVRIGENDAR